MTTEATPYVKNVRAKRSRPRAAEDKVHFEGAFLALIAFLFFTTGYASLRVSLAGFAAPLYLFVAGPFFVMRVLPRLRRSDVQHIAPMILFCAFYALTSLPSKTALVELIKVSTCIMFFLMVQRCLRTRRELSWVIFAFTLGMGILAMRGISAGSSGGVLLGINPMSGIANKNAFGAYSVPALAVGGLTILGYVKTSILRRLLVAISCLTIVAAIFSTASRGSWLLVLFVAAYWGAQNRGPKVLVAILVGCLSTYFILVNVTAGVQVVEHRLEQSQEGTGSDEARKSLFWSGLEIGLENPFIGIGVDETYIELARKAKTNRSRINAHNVYAHIAASTGLVGLGLYLFALFKLAFVFRKSSSVVARRFALLPILIFGIEGMFTHEILYIPTLWFAMALAVKFCSATTHSSGSASG